jgi:hypothetical protein
LCYLNGYTLETIDTAAELNSALHDRLASGRTQFLAFRNADPAYLSELPPFLGFHIIRDPRDIIVSSYFSHRNSHPTANWPELTDHQRRLGKLTKDEGLIADMDFCTDLTTNGFPVRPFACMRTWDYQRHDILELQYERMVIDPYATFLHIFRFLDILSDDEIGLRSLIAHILRIVGRRLYPKRPTASPLFTSWNVLSTVYDNRFEKKAAGRRRGSEDPASHYRKGVSGDWQNHFNQRHIEEFERRFDLLPEELGYGAAPAPRPGLPATDK